MTDRGIHHSLPAAQAGDQPGSTGLSSFKPPKRPRRRERPCGLPAWRRLRNSRDFARVERQGARASGDLIAVTVRPGPGRLGLVVSKKVDNRASVRNLAKRRLRDIFRQEKARYATRPQGTVDVVITARAAAATATYAAIREEALQVLEQALARLRRS